MRIVKKIKAVLKVQRRRLLVKIGATTPAEKTSTDGFTSRWSEYRSHRRVESNMPRTPEKKAAIIERLAKSPRTRKILQEKNLLSFPSSKKKLRMTDAILESLHTSLVEAQGTSPMKRQARETIYQAIM